MGSIRRNCSSGIMRITGHLSRRREAQHNASIESARAVVEGRGIAVVAQELRRLSETVKSSVNELDSKLSLLNGIVEGINPQVMHLTDQVSKQTLSIQEIDVITNRLEEASERLSSLAGESWI